MTREHWTILLVEDDPLLGDSVGEFLRDAGFEVIWTRSVAETLQQPLEGIDLAILDWQLPDGTGVDLLRTFRERRQDLPVIFLTVRRYVEDKVQAFQTGADDYLVKPFDPPELVARIHALLRRVYTQSAQFQVGDAQVDLDQGIITSPRGTYALPRKELLLLRELWKRRGKIVPYAHLYEVLWAPDETPNPASLHVFVSHLRQHLGKDAIENVRNLGYRLKA